ncbi:hypothetical protein GCM10027592_21150 [Spirosoma flavus]
MNKLKKNFESLDEVKKDDLSQFIKKIICTFSVFAQLRFIRQNEFVFKGLARMSTPFGGNILSR